MKYVVLVAQPAVDIAVVQLPFELIPVFQDGDDTQVLVALSQSLTGGFCRSIRISTLFVVFASLVVPAIMLKLIALACVVLGLGVVITHSGVGSP
jgi:hypothetical protein